VPPPKVLEVRGLIGTKARRASSFGDAFKKSLIPTRSPACHSQGWARVSEAQRALGMSREAHESMARALHFEPNHRIWQAALLLTSPVRAAQVGSPGFPGGSLEVLLALVMARCGVDYWSHASSVALSKGTHRRGLSLDHACLVM
jgi:hypothetical protein